MPFNRIPKEHWGKVWHALIAAGPTARITMDYVYAVSDKQIRMLRRKKLPFEVVPPPNGREQGERHG